MSTTPIDHINLLLDNDKVPHHSFEWPDWVEMADALSKEHGTDNIVTSDVAEPKQKGHPYQHEILHVTKVEQVKTVIDKHDIKVIYHLRGLLPAVAEKDPKKASGINLTGLINVLEMCVVYKIERLFWPSSISVFGPSSEKQNAPQHTIQELTTIYGILKAAGEGLCEWYHNYRGLDTRILRFPGLILAKPEPGGGATDWAVGLIHGAANGEEYQCPVNEDETLPMMYMPDAIRATMEIMRAPSKNIRDRRGYNLVGYPAAPQDFVKELEKHGLSVKMSYKPGAEEEIATTWPDSIDDSPAREDWGWQDEYNLAATTADMLKQLGVGGKPNTSLPLRERHSVL